MQNVALLACVGAMLYIAFNEDVIDKMGGKRNKNVVMVLLAIAAIALSI